MTTVVIGLGLGRCRVLETLRCCIKDTVVLITYWVNLNSTVSTGPTPGPLLRGYCHHSATASALRSAYCPGCNLLGEATGVLVVQMVEGAREEHRLISSRDKPRSFVAGLCREPRPSLR